MEATHNADQVPRPDTSAHHARKKGRARGKGGVTPQPVDARGGLALWTMDQGHALVFQPKADITPYEVAQLLPVFHTMTQTPVAGITEWLAATGLSRHWVRTEIKAP